MGGAEGLPKEEGCVSEKIRRQPKGGGKGERGGEGERE